MIFQGLGTPSGSTHDNYLAQVLGLSVYVFLSENIKNVFIIIGPFASEPVFMICDQIRDNPTCSAIGIASIILKILHAITLTINLLGERITTARIRLDGDWSAPVWFACGNKSRLSWSTSNIMSL